MDNSPLEILTDDFEAIEQIRTLPPIPFEPFNGLTILDFIDKFSVGSDFGLTFPYQRTFFVIYKYGLTTDSGIILVKASFEHSKYLRMYLNSVDNRTVFPNQMIFDQMVAEFEYWCTHFSL